MYICKLNRKTTDNQISIVVMMIKITFPDGNVKEFEKGTTAYQIAESISPRLDAQYDELVQLRDAMAKKLGFYDIEIFETLERGLEVRAQGVRPKTRMVGHSGYLMFARKL